MNTPVRTPAAVLRDTLQRLSPKQRQYAMLAAILLGGIGMLWLIFASADNGPKDKSAKVPSGNPSAVTNIGVMPPGQQVNPVDQWVGTAGSCRIPDDHKVFDGTVRGLPDASLS